MLDKYPKFDGSLPIDKGWSQERKVLYWKALEKFYDGEMDDLVAYLRSGFIVDGHLSSVLADALSDAWGGIKLEPKRLGNDRRPWSERLEIYNLELEIGIKAIKRLRNVPRGQADSEVREIADEHSVSISKVYKSKRLVEGQLMGRQGPAPYIDAVRLSNEFPEII